ncbi:MAG: TonB-dependent receptor [Chlorobi bacterium]|nr:TonB-dependent receptor [Chlorobiota bacterium]
MTRYFILLFSLFPLSLLLSQTVSVIDISTQKPIEHVAIYNLAQSKTSLTTPDGKADLSEFDSSDVLYFQHTSYQDYVLPYDELSKLDFVVKLTQSSVGLSEVVIAANKWEQKRSEVPNKITSIQAKEIEFYNPQTAADVLGTSNEVFIQKSQLGGGSPMIRGFAANSILIVVDGVRMNNAIYRSGNLQNVIAIDPNAIQTSEVIFGPGSIIYGSDALGGVMDFHTKSILLSGGKPHLISANALGRYSSANNELTGHFDFGFSQKNWGSFTSVSYSKFDDLKMGTVGNEDYRRLHYVDQVNGKDSTFTNDKPNIQKFSAYNQLNILQKFKFKISNKLMLDYAFHYSTTSDVPRYDRLLQYKNDSTLKYAKWYYGPQKWMMHNLGLEMTDSNLFYNNARLTLAYQNAEESRNDRKFGKTNLRSRTETVDIFTLNYDLDKRLSKKNTLFYGIESFFNKVNSTGKSTDIYTQETEKVASRYPNGGSDYSGAAFYAHLKSRLSEKITLQAGMRYSHIWLNSKFNDTTFYNFPYDAIQMNTGAITGSVGMVYKPNASWQLNTNMSSGFRAPNVDDIAKIFDSEPGNVIVPNENLKPEYAYNADLGIIKNFNDKASLDITLFYTIIDDVMVRSDFRVNGQDSILYDGEMSKVQALVNAGKGWVYGGSFTFLTDISERFGFRTNLTYMKGEDDQNEPLRHVSPLFGSTGVSYTANKTRIEVYANYNGEISYENLSASERDKPYMYATDANGNPYSPAWFTLNLKGFYQITSKLQIDLGIENILDYRYRPYSSGIVSPGRNFIVALRANL